MSGAFWGNILVLVKSYWRQEVEQTLSFQLLAKGPRVAILNRREPGAEEYRAWLFPGSPRVIKIDFSKPSGPIGVKLLGSRMRLTDCDAEPNSIDYFCQGNSLVGIPWSVGSVLLERGDPTWGQNRAAAGLFEKPRAYGNLQVRKADPVPALTSQTRIV